MAQTSARQHIVIQGAGLIGGFLGGVLAANGAQVTLLGRPRFLEPLRNGLTLTDLRGLKQLVAAADIRCSTDAACLTAADIVFTCVKSGATSAAATELAAHAKPGTLVVSFQNGVRNADVLRAGAPQCEVLAGMVPFNVMQPAPAHWHRGTEGALYIARHPKLDFLVPLFAQANVTLRFSDDMRAVLWSKILLNLNNAVNALSGTTLLQELMTRDYRLVLAACITEALAAMSAAGIEPAQINRNKPSALPGILRWPNFLYKHIAMRRLKIDSKARGSMQEDLDDGRKTEIDDINGAVVKLGAQYGVPTPVNDKISALIRDAETGQRRRFTGAELRKAVGI
jgi:2-dehydropantoate 2-reductase